MPTLNCYAELEDTVWKIQIPLLLEKGLNGIKRDRHEESSAVDLSAMKLARLCREQIATAFHRTRIYLENQSFHLRPDKRP